VLQGNFEDIRAHNAKLQGMNDDEFDDYMRHEIWGVAQCHPMASALMGQLPGKDYLAPLDMVTTVPGSLDRKVTYSIWAYNYLYRAVREYVGDTKNDLGGGLEAAKRLLTKMEGVTPQEVADGHGGKVLRDWLQEEGVEQVSGDVGPVRPTIPVYALQGRELVMYEINTVHLLFSGSTGPAQFCYERYNPEYPAFARLFNAGKAPHKAVSTLSREEAAELMKFFNAAANTQAESFILSDLVAVAGGVGEENAGNALANCVRLAQKGNLPMGAGSPEWLHGSVVRFESEDKLWQTLIAMLAAKRIQAAQEVTRLR
jgi:hypothetical protein